MNPVTFTIIRFVKYSCHNPLSNVKILHKSKMKALADNKINATQNLKFVLGREENILGKGENAGFSFSQIVFKSVLLQGR